MDNDFFNLIFDLRIDSILIREIFFFKLNFQESIGKQQ